jgi:hypothetical protein
MGQSQSASALNGKEERIASGDRGFRQFDVKNRGTFCADLNPVV